MDADRDAITVAAAGVLERAGRIAGAHRVEVYVRESQRLRVARERGRHARRSEGSERGWALRIRTPDGTQEGFAATSGRGDEVSRWLVDTAMGSMAPCLWEEAWQTEAVEFEESKASGSRATADDAAAWLDRAVGFLGERLEDAGEPESAPSKAFVEAATVTELVLNDSGLRATRSRDRAWAMAMVRHPGVPDAHERPRVVAARTLQDLDAGAWAEDLIELGGAARVASRALRLPLTLTPSASSALVSWLVQVLHGAGAPEGPAVGPGWLPLDDPTDPEAMSGGVFDDVGFPTRRRALVSEGRALRIEGAGTYRRPSFRDPPAPMVSCVVMDSPTIGLPRETCRVTSLRAIPLPDGEVLVELDGVRVSGGEAGESIRGARLRARPEELAAACVGGIGRRRLVGLGVVTPRLVLEGLTLEA